MFRKSAVPDVLLRGDSVLARIPGELKLPVSLSLAALEQCPKLTPLEQLRLLDRRLLCQTLS